MKQKTPRVVVTFHTTAEAMATERACRDGGLEGKLISAPRSLSADCGIAWSAPAETRGALETLLARAQIEYDRMCELVI